MTHPPANVNLTPLSASLEDYLEALWSESADKPVVRAKDLADRLGVRAASVTGALRKLAARGLVEHERYGFVNLTAAGYAAAATVAGKHGLLYDFLSRILGVPAVEAEQAACQLEHALPGATQKRLVQFMAFLDACPHENSGWRARFHHFLEHGALPASCRACAQRSTSTGTTIP